MRKTGFLNFALFLKLPEGQHVLVPFAPHTSTGYDILRSIQGLHHA